mmetsp:Transcript_134397/g.417690  ORF Transcript_134397/g.417690 Transcript_134397/m.417690 type:complete len:343 (-) Transcript_134397:184-1212(-)
MALVLFTLVPGVRSRCARAFDRSAASVSLPSRSMAQPYVPGVTQAVIGKPDDAAPPRAPPAVWQAANATSVAPRGAATRPPAGVQRELEILACKDPRLPPEVRLAFVKKVYGILFAMLLVTFAICTPFVFAAGKTMTFIQGHQWIIAVVGIILLAQYMFNMCMMCGAVCGNFGMMEGYIRMMKTVPWNYIYLFTFSACFGVLVGFVCAQYTVQSVLLVFGVSALLIVGLTVFAVMTKADFTGCGAYVMVLILGLLLLTLVAAFFPGSSTLHKVLGAAGAIIFGFIIVYDTQQIFGSASGSFGGGSREVEYSIDMYAFAAWNLYLDFINFFLYLLQLFGSRRD